MKKSDHSQSSVADIDALFASARESQPALQASEFTANVMAEIDRLSTPLASYVNLEQSKTARSLPVDIITGGLGVAAVAWFFDANEAITALVSIIPESIVISPISVAMALAGLSALSLASWWAVEQR